MSAKHIFAGSNPVTNSKEIVMKKISVYGLLLPFKYGVNEGHHLLFGSDFYECLGCGGKIPAMTSWMSGHREEKLFGILKNHWILCPNRLPIQPDLEVAPPDEF